MKENEGILTQQEADFCLLYVNGSAPYSGNAGKCYVSVFGTPDDCPEYLVDAKCYDLASKLMEKPLVKERIGELQKRTAYERAAIKQRINSTMLGIMEECSAQREYKNRFDEVLMPAPMRSVSIQAAKVLMDINGIKEDTVNRLQIEGAEGNGITFNLIMPESKQSDNEDEIDGGL